MADSALYSEENLQKLAEAGSQWITRVPATLTDAQAALAEADPAGMVPLTDGYRAHVRSSTYGGVVQRWVLIYSEHRRRQAQRTVDRQLLKQSTAEAKAFKKLRRTAFACGADAQQALSTFVQGLQVTHLHPGTIRAIARYAKRGRPGNATPPLEMVYQIEGALASSWAAREALVAQPCCVILATNELDECALSAQELLEGFVNLLPVDLLIGQEGGGSPSVSLSTQPLAL